MPSNLSEATISMPTNSSSTSTATSVIGKTNASQSSRKKKSLTNCSKNTVLRLTPFANDAKKSLMKPGKKPSVSSNPAMQPSNEQSTTSGDHRPTKRKRSKPAKHSQTVAVSLITLMTAATATGCSLKLSVITRQNEQKKLLRPRQCPQNV